MITTTLLILFCAAFVAELIDSSMGMMYGTLLSPILILAGFDPLIVIPALLFSQAFGGFTAAVFHHKYKNADFTLKEKSRDLKIVGAITGLGILATIFAVLVAINLPVWILKGYIGVLVIGMGVLLLSKKKFKFSWAKMTIIGLISSFNKSLSGGGFGPVVTSGQVIAGNSPRNSIASTTLSEAPICAAGFITYLTLSSFSSWPILIALTCGAFLAAPLGPRITSKINEKTLRPILGILNIALGSLVLIKLIW